MPQTMHQTMHQTVPMPRTVPMPQVLMPQTMQMLTRPKAQFTRASEQEVLLWPPRQRSPVWTRQSSRSMRARTRSDRTHPGLDTYPRRST